MTPITQEGRYRVVIERVAPEIDAGRFPIKRTVGEIVCVEADVFADGHDSVACVLQYRKEDSPDRHEIPMQPLANDRWAAEFRVTEIGRYRYTVSGWVDHFISWCHDLGKRIDPEDIEIGLQVGAYLLEEAAARAKRSDAAWLKKKAHVLAHGEDMAQRRDLALSEGLTRMMARYPDRGLATTYDRELKVVVDDARARFSSWYELFPRSWGPAGRHGTFKDVERQLTYVADMGFDVLYFPPIHPIGQSHRKGPNNTLAVGPTDVGSPWAIGAAEGGHKSIHPELGTLRTSDV